MLVKVITILSISIAICTGNIFSHAGQERQQPATSSISFHRQDVPLSYEYNSYHPPAPAYYKEENDPRDNLQYRTQNSTKLRSIIQYAPLLKSGQVQLQNTKFNKVYDHQQSLLQAEELPKKAKPLEPRLEDLPPVQSASSSQLLQHQSYPLSHFDYVPGHNVQVLRSINRSPGHNAVYRSYTDRNPAEADIQNKINELNHYIVQPSQRIHEYTTKFWINAEHSTANPYTTPSTTPSITTTTRPPTTTNTPKPYIPPYQQMSPYQQPKQYYIPKPITYILEKPIAPEKSPYTKMHSLLLNVARSYNMAMAPHRALHAGANPSLLGQLHSQHSLNQHPFMKVPGSADLRAPLAEQKTFLYPIQKNLHFTLH